mmetsp:Transcript_47821/g.64840  ORF Transcript_47821/g.64840 Transcript_47821/m.64840 type:complete len:94 (-) Transcript_47821:4-285(-)
MSFSFSYFPIASDACWNASRSIWLLSPVSLWTFFPSGIAALRALAAVGRRLVCGGAGLRPALCDSTCSSLEPKWLRQDQVSLSDPTSKQWWSV